MIERLALLVLVLFGMAGAAAAAPGDCFDADAGNRAAWRAGIDGGPGRARSGDAYAMGWNVQRAEDVCADPAFLIVAFPDQVRFSGDGFYVLGAGEGGPFGSDFAQDRVRLVVPLQRAEARTGTFDVEPYLIGGMDVEWRIVPGRKGASADGMPSGGTRIEVEPGTPRPVIQDPFLTDTPRQVVASDSGSLRLAIFDGHFQVIDRETGALVFAAEGNDPAFSPTARFLTFFGRDITVASVVDLLAERIVLELGDEGWSGRGSYVQAFAWSPGDAFLLIGYEGEGAIEFAPMLADRGSIYGEYGCGACPPWGDVLVSLEIDNSALRVGRLGQSGDEDEYTSLLSGYGDQDGPPEDETPDMGRADWLVDEQTGISAGDKVGWFLNGTPRYSVNMYEDYAGAIAAHRIEQGGTVMAAAAPDTLLGRGAIVLGDSRDINLASRAAQRLADLGLRYGAGPPAIRDDVQAQDGPDSGYFVRSGAIAQKHGLLDGNQAAEVDREARRLADESNSCAGGGRFGWVNASVWSWRAAAGFYQVVQYRCVLSTAQMPDGTVGLIWHDGQSAGHLQLAVATYEEEEAEEAGEPAGGDATPQLALDIVAQQPIHLMRLTDRLVALLSSDGNAVVLDTFDREAAATLEGLVGPLVVQELGLTPDCRHMVQLNPDGRLFVHDLKEQGTILSGLFVDDEIAVYDDQLRFESTPEGARFINVKFPGDRRLYSLDQFGGGLRSPGLVRDRLEHRPSPAGAAIGIPPRIAAAVAPAGAAADISVAGQASGPSRVVVYEDGVARWSGEMTTGVPWHAALDLRPQSRWISVQATDRAGTRSATQVLASPLTDPARARNRLFVLAVGTDAYGDPGLAPLRFAVSDATTFAEGLERGAQHYYRSVRTDVLPDSKSLREDLPAKLRAIAAEATGDDTVFLHVAGHGVVGKDKRFYLADGGTRLAALETTALSWDQIAAELATVKARVFVFLDACHSGSVDPATNDDAVETLAAAQGLSFAVIAASKGRQFSFEGADFRGGVFTASLLGALVDARPQTDTNGNGVIELSELYGAMKADVVRKTRGHQTPWIASSNFVGEVPLY